MERGAARLVTGGCGVSLGEWLVVEPRELLGPSRVTRCFVEDERRWTTCCSNSNMLSRLSIVKPLGSMLCQNGSNPEELGGIAVFGM